MATVFNQMIEYAPVIEKAFDEKKINFLTLEFPKKTYKKWGHLQSKSNSIKKLKNHKTNIGIMLGFNRKNQDYYLAGLDLDGFNPTPKQLKSMQELSKKEKEIITNLTPEERLSIRNKTREDLYNLLKVLPDIWKNCTANQGYHLFYWTKRDFPNKFLENIFYPEDYPIKFLRNKSITFLTKHIEHFTYGRQFVAPFSEIKQNDGTKSYYYFISTREELTEFFENPQPKENILDEIKELVQNSDSGFTYKEPITTEPTPTTKNNKKPSKENTQINTGTGLLKSKISNPDIRSELLENIIKSGYTHGNMNNLGYVLVCNFRTGGLNKNEVYQIFKDLPIENHNLNLVKGWINNKFNINLNSRDFKKFAGLNALYTEIEAHANSEDKKYLKEWFKKFFSKNDKPQNMIIKPSSEDIKNMDADSILFECRGCGKAYILVKNLMDDNIKEPKLCTECGAKSFKQMSVFTSKKTILIEDTESKISLLSIKGNLQLLYYDQNNNTLIKEIDIKNYDTILADFAYDIIKTDLKNKYEPEIIREKAIKTVNNLFMTLGRVIRTKNYNGHFYKATNHISTIKEILIQQDTAETEIQKLFKPEEITRINYSDLLTQLQTGKNPINPGEDKNREQTFNEIAKILKTELGLRQELEIKGMEILSDYIYDYYIKTKYNTLEKISEQKLYIHSLKLLHGIDEIPEDMETNFKKTHLKVVLNYIPTSYRHYNILTVGNGLYDMENHEYLSPEDIINRFNEPIITHKSTPYNYNPEAKSKLIKPVLSYAFDPYTIDFNPEIDEIKGFFEVTGYSFTSGNIDQVMCFMFGVPNSAKSLLNKLIVKLHGNRVSSLAVEKFSDRFGKSALVNVQLNSIKDIKNAIIYDNGDYKQVIGDEEIGYEAKGKPFAIIPPLEVPMSIASGNVLPNFENPEPAILRRMLNINFKYRVPTATKVDDNNEVIDWHEDDLNIVKDLKNKRKELGIKLPIPHVQKDLEKKITDNDEEMEWLLHNSLEHERKRIQNNNRIFSIDKSDKKILDDLELYSKPVETLLKDTIIFEDENSHDVGVCTTDLFKLLRAKAKKNFVDLPKTNSSLGKKVKKAIINLFDLDKKYVTVSSRKKLDLNNAVVECDRTRIYPQIKYNVLGLTKKIR